MGGVWRVRAAVLTLVGALGVHHGRYALASEEHAHETAAAHAYLTWLAPVTAVALFLTLVHLAARLGQGAPANAPALPSGRRLWIAATGTLLAVFAAQECLETLLAHGSLPSLGDRAWTALPFALAAGGAIAFLLRGAHAVVRRALARAPRPGRGVRTTVAVPPATVLAAPRSVLARRLAGRAPPRVAPST